MTFPPWEGLEFHYRETTELPPCQTNCMPRIFQTLLLWLLMAALPIQGMTTVVKTFCGAERHDLVQWRLPRPDKSPIRAFIWPTHCRPLICLRVMSRPDWNVLPGIFPLNRRCALPRLVGR